MAGVRSLSTFKPGLILSILLVVIVLGGIALAKKKEPAHPTAAETEMTLALKNVEKGDIVRFDEHPRQRYRMVAYRVGDDIFFKVPMCQSMAMRMTVNEAADQATDVIKYNSTSVAWTNAAYMLMTGEYVPEKPSSASR